ncbi:MAG: DedA family protein [Bacteroidales bacterium]|nr:DedA family protein [Bacteroidales bacterium]
MQTLIEWSYFGLFIATFLAGSILPFSSEIVLSGLLAVGANSTGCLLAATAGNFLGGITCYYLGHLGKIEWIEKYLGVSDEKMQKGIKFLHGKGAFMAFFTFIPIVGDLLAVSLGYMRANIWITSISMLLGKFVRYILWIYVTIGVIGILK